MAIQAIKYKCCGVIFSVCQEPMCYTDKDYLKGLKKYVEDGHTVEMVEHGDGWRDNFGSCKCPVEVENKDQLKMFEP